MKRILLVLFILILTGTTTYAQPSLADSTALEAYFDGVINTYLQEDNISGATLGIIKDGQPLLVKGYGYADDEARQPVSADSTLFRIGSISKTFVWTSVMQLVEQGSLDLNTDINNYLDDIQIPETYEEPITMRHLMTHTPGFEEYFLGLFAEDSSKVRPLSEILSDQMPARVRPPGELASYSNHGTGIAALAVEQISGMSFEDYVEQNILQPLQMNATTFRQPVPDRLRSQLSKGYAFASGEFREKPFEYVPLGPVGAASSTASDMLRYMQAHLNLGELNGTAILDSAIAATMQSPAFRHADEVNPSLLGFYEMSQNSVRIFGHGGATQWFHSEMALFPEQNLGLFLSFNSQNGSGKGSEILKNFVDQFFPERGPFADTLSFDKQQLQKFAGSYRALRYPHKRLTKVAALGGSIPVTLADNGRLKTMINSEAEFWVPIDSLTFRKVNSSENLAFRENEAGEITHLFRDDLPIIAFERIPLISSQELHLSLFLITGLSIIIALTYWPAAYLIRRKYRPSMIANDPLPFNMKLAAWGNALILLIFYIGLAISVSSEGAIIYGLPTLTKVMLIFPILSVIATLLMIYYSWQIWNESLSGMASRVCYSLLTLVFVVHLWQLWFWNILGFQY